MQIGLMANAWYLTRVEDRFGNELYRFIYQRGKYIIPISIAFEYSKISTTYLAENYGGPLWIGHSFMHSGTSILSDKYFPFSVMVNLPVYLNQIVTASGNSVSFTMNTNIRLSSTNFYNTIFTEFNTNPSLSTLLAKQTGKMGLPLSISENNYSILYHYIHFISCNSPVTESMILYVNIVF